MPPPVFDADMYELLFGHPAPWLPRTHRAKVFETQEERAKHQVATKMRTYTFDPIEEMSMRELKNTCALLNVKTDGFLEKAEFVKAATERRETTCGFCMEDFVAGEELRATACGHLGHEECFVAWFGRSAAKSLVCWTCRGGPFLLTSKRKRE